MNGTPSTNSPDGVLPGNGGDAVNPARGPRQRVDAITDAWLALEEAAQGDVDLVKAQEKVAQWLAREAGSPKGG